MIGIVAKSCKVPGKILTEMGVILIAAFSRDLNIEIILPWRWPGPPEKLIKHMAME